MNILNGYKTYIGAAIVGGSAILRVLGHEEYANILMTVGGALGIVGIGHKIQKG